MQKTRTLKLSKQKDSHNISFNAMASPCEVIIQTENKRLAEQVAQCVSHEVWRIEDKYSRYDSRSICSQINTSGGKRIAIDEETYLLLNFAEQCYQLSDGLFDLSSGVLRKVWSFDSLSGECKNFPSTAEVNKLLSFVGWNRVIYDQQSITLPQNMELDFGGIGKEYAVDRSILLAKKITDEPILVNLGGDLAVTGPRLNDQAWQVAIEHPDSDVLGQPQDMIVALNKGALATSGDARRYLIKEGIRYGHVLNAKTGWPIINAPRSITTVAPQCIQAGILATLALLQGEHAEQFLTEQDITFLGKKVTNSMRILLVEDDQGLAEALQQSLEREGFVVDHLSRGKLALTALAVPSHDMVILDLGLPDIDGLDVLKEIRAKKNDLPVIILTARDSIDSKVKGLDYGADDYLAKPFDMQELLARLRVIERRLGTASSSMITIDRVSLDTKAHKVFLLRCTNTNELAFEYSNEQSEAENNGKEEVNGASEVHFSKKEFMVLKALMENAGRIQSREQIESKLYHWGEEVLSNAVEVHIHKLRKSLPNKFIQNVRGVGYIINHPQD